MNHIYLSRMKNFWLLACLLSCCIAGAQTNTIAHGHAHNDYVHKRPLEEALENGFTSIEIDVFLHKGQLKVAHVPLGLDDKKTLEELYLEPIAKRVRENGGWVYKGVEQPVIFMIDFKTEGTETYAKLKEVMTKYADIITTYSNGVVKQQRAVNILISGSSPVTSLMKEETSACSIDGGIGSIGNTDKRKVCSRYSSSWGSYFNWKGKGPMPPKQRELLDSLVAQVHAQGKEIRFWAIPDNERVWKVLLDAGVDWVNTNRLAEYNKFWQGRKKD